MNKFLIIVLQTFIAFINPFIAIYISALFYKIRNINIMLIAIAVLILLSKTNINVKGDDIYYYLTAFSYLKDFETVLTVSLVYASSIDILFWYPSYFLSLITHEPNIFLFFWYLASLFLLFYAYNKISIRFSILFFVIFLSTTTFYYIYGNAIRQAVTVSLSILSLSFYINNQSKKAYYLSILSIFFHPTGLIISFVLFATRLKFKYIYILLLLAIILSNFSILSIFGYIFDIVNLSHFSEKMFHYSSESYNKSIFSFGTGLFFYILVLNFYITNRLKKEVLPSTLLKVYILYQILYFSLLQTGIMSDRIFSFRAVLDPVLLILLLDKLKQKTFAIYLAIAAFMILNLINIVFFMNMFLYSNEFNLISLNFLDLINLISLKFQRL